METPPPPVPQPNFPTILGWVCFAIGLLTFWAFGLGFLFLFGALAIALTALIKTQSRQGLILLVFSAASLPLCAILFVFLFPFLAVFGAVVYQKQLLTSFINPSRPAPRHPFVLGGRHFFATRTMPSPDDETHFVVDDSGAVCSSIRIDGQPWQHGLGESGVIEPGRHEITCDGGTHPYHFEAQQGKTIHVTHWRP